MYNTIFHNKNSFFPHIVPEHLVRLIYGLLGQLRQYIGAPRIPNRDEDLIRNCDGFYSFITYLYRRIILLPIDSSPCVVQGRKQNSEKQAWSLVEA